MVRKFIVAQLPTEGLRALQADTVPILLALRPEAGFCPNSDVLTREGYVAHHLYTHMRASLNLTEGEEPPMTWVTDPDYVVNEAVALAVGREKLQVSFIRPRHRPRSCPRPRPHPRPLLSTLPSPLGHGESAGVGGRLPRRCTGVLVCSGPRWNRKVARRRLVTGNLRYC